MDTQEKTAKNTLHGHAIKRHTPGMKQEALVADMGISQAFVPFYKQKKVIDDDTIGKFAKALNVASELIKELEEDPGTFIFESNTVEKGGMTGIYNIGCIHNNPNPINRIIELVNEKTALYERMPELKKEKNVVLEKLLKDRQ